MSGGQKGSLILKTIPNKEVEERVVSYLSRLMKNVSPEVLSAKVKKTPLLLSKNVTAEHGRKIVATLAEIGALAVFVPHMARDPETGAAPVKPVRPEVPGRSRHRQKPIPATPAKQGQRKWVKLALAASLLVISLSLLTWRLYPYIGSKIPGNQKQEQTPQQQRKAQRLPSIDFATHRPYNENAPSIMKVAPQDMYGAFLYQYRLRPDTRFAKAFEVLIDTYGRCYGLPKSKNAYTVGEVRLNRKEVVVPLLKGDLKVISIKMSLPVTFPKVMSALNQCLEAMTKGVGKPSEDLQKNTIWQGKYKSALRNFHLIDPRAVISGLMILDELWRLEGPDPRLLLAAARGHAILLLALTPDRMQYSDIFASHALSYLALAKWVDPTLPFTREEAFLAMNMGYTAHADRLLQEGGPGEAELADRIFDDYMRQDLAALKNHLGDGSRVLSYYLLARLYREMGLFREAEQMTEGLYKRFPNLYPAMTEIIFSANLSAAKEMTIYYPLDILARMEHEISPKSLQDEKTWQKRAKIIAGEQSEGSISFSHFEKLMSGWRPFKTNGSPHIFIDEAKVKTIFRSLYTDAIYLRFNVLLNRWSVLEKASNYVESLATEDKDHPLILTMMAEVKVESGNRAEAESICTKVINHPQSSAVLTTIAHYYVQDILTSIKLAPAVAAKMDGRPESLFNMGFVFERLYNYDLAQKYHTLGLKLNPYNYGMYKNLARVSGSHESLSLALERSPHSFKLMEVAAEYFAGKREKEFKLKALEFYDKALDLVPTHKTLSLEKASVLSDLGRHGEAIRVLNDWIDRNGRRDLVTTFYKSSIASNYLKMGNPRLALKVLTKDVDTYQAGVMMNLARVYEALAEPDRAEEIYRKAVQRYPNADHVLSGMAGFMWRNDRDLEAAEYIAKGRKIEGLFSRWYFEDYMEVFAQSQKDRIIKSVDSLMAQGTPSAEIQRLAFTFEKESRPDIAFQLLRKSAPRGTMEQLESNVHIYEVLEKWKGDQEAIKYLQQTVPAQLRAPLVMVLFKRGLFDLILIETQNPAAYPPRYREFMWLQRLLAWLALDKKPAALEEEFAKHYEKSSSDYYHSIGRFMCGKISQGDLLKLIKTPKQRCEFAYYIGLCERLKNNFPEASNWYHLCRETLLSNNGEFHWASAELFWWAHMGTKNRHRLLRHDMEAYHKAHPAKYQTG